MNNSSGSFSSTDGYVSAVHQIRLTTTSIAFVVSVIGNALVIAVVKRKASRSIHDIVILNLALTDVLFVTVTLSKALVLVLRAFPLFYCTALRHLSTMAFCSSVFTITSMAILRCRTLCYPYKPKVRRKTVYAWICFLWLVSFLVILPPMLVAMVTAEGNCTGNWASQAHKDAYIIGLLLLKCILPLVIITCAYVKIGIYLVQNKTPQTCLEETGGVNYRAVARKENIQVVKVSATIVLLFGLCTAPHQVAWMLRQFGKAQEREIANVIFKFSYILQNIHACVNPFIYGIMSRQFRQDYMKIFACLLDWPIFRRCFRKHQSIKKRRYRKKLFKVNRRRLKQNAVTEDINMHQISDRVHFAKM